MQEIKLSKMLTIKGYDGNDFEKCIDDITLDCTRIIASYEIFDEFDDESFDNDYDFEQDKEALKQLYTNYLINETGYYVFILYNQNTPIGFAIYSNIENTDSYILEFIHVRKDYAGMGYGTTLLRHTALNLKNYAQAGELVSTINKNNARSLAMHESFVRSANLKCYFNDYGDKIAVHMDIGKLSENNPTFEQCVL